LIADVLENFYEETEAAKGEASTTKEHLAEEWEKIR
jgi:hypothetical protein